MEFDELLEDLDDLVDLATHEGYIAFAQQLANFRAAVRHNRGAFCDRAAASSTSPSPPPPSPIDLRD